MAQMGEPRGLSMLIYVINLDRDPDRYTGVQQQFEAAGVLSLVVRVPAVDAQAPDFSSPGYAPHSWRDRWELKLSEQAVFESHRSVWQRIADGTEPCGIVCEDDILVSSEIAQLLPRLDCARHGVTKLDGFATDRRYGETAQMAGIETWEIVQAVPSAACYALSQTAARILIAQSQSFCDTLDDFLFRPRDGISPAQIHPAVAVQQMCCDVAGNTGRLVSVREARDGSQVARGPLLYRLVKQVKRGVRQIQTRGNPKKRPGLASDLPEYKR